MSRLLRSQFVMLLFPSQAGAKRLPSPHACKPAYPYHWGRRNSVQQSLAETLPLFPISDLYCTSHLPCHLSQDTSDTRYSHSLKLCSFLSSNLPISLVSKVPSSKGFLFD